MVRGLVLFAASLAASVVIAVGPAPADEASTAVIRIALGGDDAEETSTRWLDTTSSDLELGVETTPQAVGLRFTGLQVPVGAVVTAAWIQFTVDEVGTTPASLTIQAEASADAAPFSGRGGISSRPRTGAAVSWTPPPWATVGEAGPAQRTPDLAPIVQAVVSRPDWRPGASLVIVLTGSGTRTAESFEGSPSQAPRLHVEWGSAEPGATTVPTSSTTPPAPTTTTTTPPAAGTRYDGRIAAGSDDVEELGNGWLYVASSDLELVEDGGIQTVGLRLAGVGIPRGAVVTAAWVEFVVDEPDSAPADLTIRMQDAGNAPPFSGSRAVTGRASTPAVSWTPGPWQTVGASLRTPDLSGLVQQVVGRSDWSPGNALAVIIGGQGTRTARAREAGADTAPRMVIEWTQGAPDPVATTTTSTTITSSSTTTTSAPATTTTTSGTPGTVRLAVIGDYGSGNARQGQVADMIASVGVDAIVTTGDNVYASTGYDRLVGRYYHPWIGGYRGEYGTGAVVNRFFPSLGNHDYLDVGVAAYLDYFSLPGSGVATTGTSGSERYYDAAIGPVHLFVLDTPMAVPGELSTAGPQALWLRQALAMSDAAWNLVVFHNPPYASTPGKTRAELRWPFAAWGADLVLTGDAHVYERLRVEGFDYVISGLGINHEPLTTARHPGSVTFYSADDAGALFIVACRTALHLEYRTLAAGVVDRATLGSGSCR